MGSFDHRALIGSLVNELASATGGLAADGLNAGFVVDRLRTGFTLVGRGANDDGLSSQGA